MTTDPQIEPVTDEDVAACINYGSKAQIRAILLKDRRRVAERQAGRQGDYNPASLSHEAANAELAHISGTISDAREIERLRAEVARLTAAGAAKDGVIIRFLNAPLAQRDGTPVPSLLLASARAALSDTAGAGWIDASGAVEGSATVFVPSHGVEVCASVPAEWDGDDVLIVRVP